VQTDIESALIGISHLAERLGLSRRTIHRILARGELPSLQIGRRRLIRLSDVRRWLNGCETPAPGANATNLSRRFVEHAALR
jgi:excisionase family DNA binding protein